MTDLSGLFGAAAGERSVVDAAGVGVAADDDPLCLTPPIHPSSLASACVSPFELEKKTDGLAEGHAAAALAKRASHVRESDPRLEMSPTSTTTPFDADDPLLELLPSVKEEAEYSAFVETLLA